MSDAKKIIGTIGLPPFNYEPYFKNAKKMKREYLSVDENRQYFLDRASEYMGISPTFLGASNFLYMALKDCDGLWALPLYKYGVVCGYIMPRNYQDLLPERSLCHTSRNYAWLYDDFGNITQFKADLIKFYCVKDGFIITQTDLNKDAEEDNTNGHEVAKNNRIFRRGTRGH